tara:strand:+ start:3275 stop:3508 length:234 start_codon:yes stop_codon:yes gene_type:complete
VSSRAAQIYTQALELEIDERAELASQMIASIDGLPDADAESAWAAEIESRARRAITGETQGIDWTSIRSRVKSKLAR